MRLPEVIDAVAERSGFRLRVNGSQFVWAALGRPERNGSGYPTDYGLDDVERCVVWCRMHRYFGHLRNDTGRVNEVRRMGQDAVPTDHRPGWVVMSGGKAWFQTDPPADLILSGQGAAAVRVHDDCGCEA